VKLKLKDKIADFVLNFSVIKRILSFKIRNLTSTLIAFYCDSLLEVTFTVCG